MFFNFNIALFFTYKYFIFTPELTRTLSITNWYAHLRHSRRYIYPISPHTTIITHIYIDFPLYFQNLIALIDDGDAPTLSIDDVRRYLGVFVDPTSPAAGRRRRSQKKQLQRGTSKQLSYRATLMRTSENSKELNVIDVSDDEEGEGGEGGEDGEGGSQDDHFSLSEKAHLGSVRGRLRNHQSSGGHVGPSSPSSVTKPLKKTMTWAQLRSTNFGQ